MVQPHHDQRGTRRFALHLPVTVKFPDTPTGELPHKRLSDREYEVFRLLAAGESVSGIAERLHLSVKTVSTHKTHVLEKMKLGSLAELVRYAITHHLLDSPDIPR